ncbi:hypothetical protein NQD34_006492, partial [Periophthalmus magnuspinnatus]
TMWKAILLMVCLLVAGVQPIENPVYGVKLCGREFIRAVIFTCGGSRWKRSLMSTGETLNIFNVFVYYYSTEGLPQNSAETILQRNKDSAFTSKDSGNKMFTRQARSFISDEILEALRKADRKGRDLVLGLSSACCKWGCSKSEISSLC